ncbi:MAG: vWA domain-containing protein [Nannocystales bacterium]
MSLLAAGAIANADRLGLPWQVLPESVEVQLAGSSADSKESPSSQDQHEEQEAQQHRHKGEEGKMGRASAKHKSGLYALKGPKNSAPQMARNLDSAARASNAGVLGQIRRDSGHFLASPYSAAFALGDDDGDVWGGLAKADHEGNFGHDLVEFNPFTKTLADPKSTFSIDVDTAAYANVRRLLFGAGQAPPPSVIRTEEMINYFDYDYAEPTADVPFSVNTEVAPAPWDAAHRIVHIGIQGKTVHPEEIPPRNLVFLIDVSGSMSTPGKLGLVKRGLSALAAQMNGRDRISLVVYAGAAGAVLPPTSGADHEKIDEALTRLRSGGSTNGAEGIHLAYKLARRSFIKGGINRVLLATDGDFNVGTTGHDALMRLIEAKRKTGVYLSVLGVGGSNFNDHMMEQLADKGNGNYAYLDSELEAHKVLVEESGAMLQTIAKDVKIQVEFDPDQVASHRLIGYENRLLAHQDFDDDTKDAGEIGAGHTVTALYEVIPAKGADADPLMTLSLRYKEPDGERSQRIRVPVRDGGLDLADASDDYRFSAAVAMLGQKLRGHDAQAKTTYGDIVELAWGSMGADPYCYRHQFVQLAAKAGEVQGEFINAELPQCHTTSRLPVFARTHDPAETPAEEVLEAEVAWQTDEEPFDWGALVVEVLRLLPPLLALPIFALAFWRPRRRLRA